MEIIEMDDGKWGNIVWAPLIGSLWHTSGSCWSIMIWETRADLDSHEIIEVTSNAGEQLGKLIIYHWILRRSPTDVAKEHDNNIACAGS